MSEAVWYGKLSGRFWRHPKALALSPAAGWLWTRALSYVVDQRTDGVVATPALRALEPKHGKKLAAELVEAGLWELHASGHVFHDFADHGMTVAAWEEKKKADRERKANGKRNASEAGPPGFRSESERNDTWSPTGIHPERPATPSREDSGLRTQDSRVPERDLPAASDRSGRARESGEVSPAAAGSSFASMAEVAWTRVVGERGGAFAPEPTTDGPRLRNVAELVNARRGAVPLSDALLASARAHMAQRTSGRGTPRSWLEWLQREASAGEPGKRQKRARGEDPDKYRPTREWVPDTGADNVVPIGSAAASVLAALKGGER